MYPSASAVLLFVATGFAQISKEEPPRGYHRLVGIPAAKRAKEWEDRIHSDDTRRIYKGENVSTDDLPYYPFFGGLLVSFSKLSDEISSCGSSLLTFKRLVTAAHCWDDGHSKGYRMTVVLGSTHLYYGGWRIDTDKVIVHPEYDAQRLLNDIAMIYLPEKVPFASSIFPIALPEGREVNQSFVGQWARALGEGLTENSPNDGGRTLKSVTLQIVSEAECTKSLRHSPHPGQLCTSGKSRLGTCRGDSGGPLFTYTNRKFLIGITSSGPDDVCGTQEVSVYVRVSYYLKFIAEHAVIPRFKFKFIQKGDGQDIENITVVIWNDA